MQRPIVPLSGREDLQVTPVVSIRTPKLSFVPPHHLFQIYDTQLQASVLTAFPISLSNALVLVPSMGYLAFQHGQNQFTPPPQDHANKDLAGSSFCFVAMLLQDR